MQKIGEAREKGKIKRIKKNYNNSKEEEFFQI